MMTTIHLKRLQKLHDFVKANVKGRYFDMGNFRKADDDFNPDVNEVTLKEHTCGTHGCLMGWTPFAMRPTMRRMRLIPKSKHGSVKWAKAAEKLFNIQDPGNNSLWKYLFSGTWADGEGYSELSGAEQKRAALKRIRKVIKSKGVMTEEMKAELDQIGGH